MIHFVCSDLFSDYPTERVLQQLLQKPEVNIFLFSFLAAAWSMSMSITSEWLLTQKPESNRSELWSLRHVISDLPWTTPFPRFLVGCSTTFSTVSARRLRSTPGSSTSMKTRSSPTCYLIVAIKYLDHKTYQKRHLCIDHERHPSVVSLKSNPKITILLPALQQQKESDLPSKGAQFPKQMDVRYVCDDLLVMLAMVNISVRFDRIYKVNIFLWFF